MTPSHVLCFIALIAFIIFMIVVYERKVHPPKTFVCPNCKSNKLRLVSSYQHEVIAGKTKTTYSANLNPLKPFTIANKKEKVVRPAVNVTKGVFQCENCGNTFNGNV